LIGLPPLPTCPGRARNPASGNFCRASASLIGGATKPSFAPATVNPPIRARSSISATRTRSSNSNFGYITSTVGIGERNMRFAARFIF
jgi:hypothetical protein